MSYAVVEIEVSNLLKTYLYALAAHPSDQRLLELGEQLESYFGATQSGLEEHIRDCEGVVEALREVRFTLSQDWK